MSNSEVSFSRFLDEGRKFGAVMYCIHQVLGNLPTGIENSLQNCISLVLRAGYLDSSKLTASFYRPQAPRSVGLIEWVTKLLEGMPQEHSAFETVTTVKRQLNRPFPKISEPACLTSD